MGAAVLGVHVAKALITLTPRDSDFLIFYVSALQARLGASMYFLGDVLFRNHNPPHFHLVVLPFTYLPTAAAWVLWTMVSMILAVWVTRMSMRASTRVWTSHQRWILAACLLNAAGVQTAIRTGQLTWLIAGLVTAAWLTAREQRWTLSAVFAGLAISVKPFLLVLLGFYLVRRQWRALITATSVVALGITAGALTFGIESAQQWMVVLRTRPAPELFLYFVNASLTGFVVRAGWPMLVGTIVSAVLLILTMWRVRSADDDRAWAILLVAALLASPIACMYYAPLFLGPLIVLLHERRLAAPRSLIVPLVFPPIGVEPFPSGVLQLSFGSVYMWGFLLLWVTLWVRRDKESGSRSSRPVVRTAAPSGRIRGWCGAPVAELERDAAHLEDVPFSQVPASSEWQPVDQIRAPDGSRDVAVVAARDDDSDRGFEETPHSHQRGFCSPNQGRGAFEWILRPLRVTRQHVQDG